LCLLYRVYFTEPKGKDEDEEVDEVQEDVEIKRNTVGIVGDIIIFYSALKLC
jgi:hypothetical protein